MMKIATGVIISLVIISILIYQYNMMTTTEISVAEFETKLGENPERTILDVRTSEEFAEYRIKGAINFQIRDTAFVSQIKTLDKTKPVFVYCLGGVRSKNAVKVLKENGFTQIFELANGIDAWVAENKPIEK